MTHTAFTIFRVSEKKRSFLVKHLQKQIQFIAAPENSKTKESQI